MEGNITDFTASIRARYPLQKRVGGDRYYIYKGPVYGHNCYLKAEYSRKSKTVYRITVTPQHIDQNAMLDSLKFHYGEPEEVKGGYAWARPEGYIYFSIPEGYDPVLTYLDKEGVARFKEEK